MERGTKGGVGRLGTTMRRRQVETANQGTPVRFMSLSKLRRVQKKVAEANWRNKMSKADKSSWASKAKKEKDEAKKEKDAYGSS